MKLSNGGNSENRRAYISSVNKSIDNSPILSMLHTQN